MLVRSEHLAFWPFVLLLFWSSMATAADYSSWRSHDPAPAILFSSGQLAQGKDTCCKHCTKGQPCGNSCISANAKCKQPPGCAC